MIISGLRAENIFKYRKLELKNLPASGRIGITGPNEAGKTAIGGTICFALFGRSYALASDQLGKAIRWGEFRGSVRLEFAGQDDKAYVLVREVDTEQNHTARLNLVGESQPIAQGVSAVAEKIEQVIGFNYDHFVHSFYLAQREVEVPHAKSDTVKSLIGVGALEKVSQNIRNEIGTSQSSLAKFESQLLETRSQLQEFAYDKNELERLEVRQNEKQQAIREIEGRISELKERERSIKKAAEAFCSASARFAESTLSTRYAEWREKQGSVSKSLVAVAAVSEANGAGSPEHEGFDLTEGALKSFEAGLEKYEELSTLADYRRKNLRSQLALENSRVSQAPPAGNNGKSTNTTICFADREKELDRQIVKQSGARKPKRVLGGFFAFVAAVSWAAWGVLQAAPTSSIATKLTSLLSMSEGSSPLVILVAAVGTSFLAVVFFGSAASVSGEIKGLRQRIAEIEAQAAKAQQELSMIESINDATFPEVMVSLQGIDDGTVRDAAVAFRDGDGAIFVRPDALESKLKELKRCSAKAEDSLKDSRAKLQSKTDTLQADVTSARTQATDITKQIEIERKRRHHATELETMIANLREKSDHLRHRVEVLGLGRQLIDGTCRRIYAKFQPELRRFVGKVLPKLTDDRYQHLQIDEDLNVRVFSKKKNDFVGLDEVSNSTHRQLMLSLRLALAQALICSTTKASQFIFFDEPFAFFDKQRMQWAVEVVDRISPQMTQVWLAAQEFGSQDAFDVEIKCDADSDTLFVDGALAGKRIETPTMSVA